MRHEREDGRQSRGAQNRGSIALMTNTPPDPERIDLRTFLETAPLYKDTPVATPDPGTIDLLRRKQKGEGVKSGFPDSIRLRCSICKLDTSWTRTEEAVFCDAQSVAYACADCGKAKMAFWLHLKFGDPVQEPPRTLSNHMTTTTRYRAATVRKIGQSVLPTPHTPKALDKLLGSDGALYRKGLACMSEGFGLGAVAYFRRVIEDKTSEIIDRMRAVAEKDGDAERVKALDAAKASQTATERMKTAVDAVPPALRPGGINPLGLLYGAFSEELHASESDEDALKTAQELQRALDVLVRRLVEYEEDARTLGELRSRL